MDVLSDVLHQARVRNAIVRKLIQPPPWSFYLADPEPLTAVAALEARMTIVLHDASTRAAVAAAPSGYTLEPGDIALVKGGAYTIADSLTTPCQVIVRNGHKYAADGSALADQTMTAARTFGDRRPNAVTMLHGIYELHGSTGDRFLQLLPPIITVPAGPRTRPLLDLLATEAAHDEPGQDAVLQRLLDLILVIALRSWGTGAASRPPGWLGWLGAIADPAIGRALQMLHTDPQHRWTTAALAKKVDLSRAAFSARFTDLVGQPPMAYLAGWRMALAADMLRNTDLTIAAVARKVGYDNAFSFSTAFKRTHRKSPTNWRQTQL